MERWKCLVRENLDSRRSSYLVGLLLRALPLNFPGEPPFQCSFCRLPLWIQWHRRWPNSWKGRIRVKLLQLLALHWFLSGSRIDKKKDKKQLNGRTSKLTFYLFVHVLFQFWWMGFAHVGNWKYVPNVLESRKSENSIVSVCKQNPLRRPVLDQILSPLYEAYSSNYKL